MKAAGGGRSICRTGLSVAGHGGCEVEKKRPGRAGTCWLAKNGAPMAKPWNGQFWRCNDPKRVAA